MSAGPHGFGGHFKPRPGPDAEKFRKAREAIQAMGAQLDAAPDMAPVIDLILYGHVST